jgi:hypothetical protein
MPSYGWRGNAVAEWGFLEAQATRPDLQPDAPVLAGTGEDEPSQAIPGRRRSGATAARVRLAIADAMGVDVDDVPTDGTDMDEVADVINHDLTDPQAAWAALDVALSAGRYERPATEEEVRQAERTIERIDRFVAKAGESDGAYRVREGNWREQHGVPRKRKHQPPNRSPERRRLERIRAKARRLGISVEEAEALSKRRPTSDTNLSPEVSPRGINDPTTG